MLMLSTWKHLSGVPLLLDLKLGLHQSSAVCEDPAVKSGRQV